MNRVFVGNLPRDIRIIDIDNFFRPFGKLVSIDVNHRANPVHAYVEFDNARNAFNAVKSRHGYDYEGYTLQLRLVENEARGRRDATPPPPPPPMFRGYENRNNVRGDNNDMRGNFSNSFQTNSAPLWPNGNRSGIQPLQQNMSQYSTSNRLGMSQQNMSYSNNRSNQQQSMTPFSGGGRLDMQQQYSNSNRPNMDQYSSLNRANNQQQFNNSNFSNQYANSNRSNMSLQNTNLNQSVDMFQNNMMNYSNNNRSNISQQQQSINMTNSSSNGSWVIGDSMGWNTGSNSGGNINNNADNFAYGGYDTDSELSKFTTGLSGAGRRWFKRYLSKGFSPELARTKAIEHRTMPYLRDDPKSREIGNNPTNAALETIGNTIISLLSTNQPDNMGANFGMPGPSSTNKMAPQIPRNAVSKRQYIKSLDILRTIRDKRMNSPRDRISKKYHTQIVKDYEQVNKINKSYGTSTFKNSRNDRAIISNTNEEQLSEQIRKRKRDLLKSARIIENERNGKRPMGGAYKKRVKILMNDAGFSELEAKALASNPLEELQDIISMKQEYDMITKKTDFIPANTKVLGQTPKIVVYRNDIKYLKMYQKHKISQLSQRIITALNQCITRIHKYEKEKRLPLTQNKFVALLQKIASSQKSKNENKKGSSTKDIADKKTTKVATKTTGKNENIKSNDKTKAVDEKQKASKEKNVENNADTNDNKNIAEENSDITEEQNDGNGEILEDSEDKNEDLISNEEVED